MVRLIGGHALDILRTLGDESVHCVITSPPYWGLRDYGLEPVIWGGDKACKHVWGEEYTKKQSGGDIAKHWKTGGIKDWDRGEKSQGSFCTLCGAWRGNLGLEPTLELYIGHIVEIFRELRRVLRKDGTCWMNIGDSYATNPAGNRTWGNGVGSNKHYQSGAIGRSNASTIGCGLKPKDLCMIPARVALALQADGWWLRSDIIWAKPNPMPESVTDRPTKAHEYIFLLTKSARYFYDADAVREPVQQNNTPIGSENAAGILSKRHNQRQIAGRDYGGHSWGVAYCNNLGRNLRSVWTISTHGFPEAHFATFPEKLVEPMIRAGTSERGVCSQCGKPWKRVVKVADKVRIRKGSDTSGARAISIAHGHTYAGNSIFVTGEKKIIQTTGWQPTCTCYDENYRREYPKARRARKRYQHDATGAWWIRVRRRPGSPSWPTTPATVLDPFAGSGTVGVVCKRLGRQFIGIDANPEYIGMARRRIEQAQAQQFELEL